MSKAPFDIFMCDIILIWEIGIIKILQKVLSITFITEVIIKRSYFETNKIIELFFLDWGWVLELRKGI